MTDKPDPRPRSKKFKDLARSRVAGRVMIGAGTIIGVMATMGLMIQPGLVVIEVMMAIGSFIMVRLGRRNLRPQRT